MLKKTIFFGLVLLYSSSNVFADWRYSNVTDQMTDETVYIATTTSLNTLNFGFPYSGVQKGSLTLRNHPRHGLDMIVSIEQGQILCRSYQDCSVTMRLGTNPAKNQSAIGASDSSSNVIFIRDPEYIAPKLSSSKKLLIELPVYQEGNVLLEFKTENLDAKKLGGFNQSTGSENKKTSTRAREVEPNNLEQRLKAYTEQIGQRIKRYWVKPSSVPYGLSVKLKIDLIPGGDIKSVRITETSGNALFDSSIENAAYKAAPMPSPSDVELANVVKDSGLELMISIQ